MELAPLFLNGNIVDARLSTPHPPFIVEFPKLVSVSSKPLALGVVVFVLEADGDPVLRKAPERLGEAIVEFLLPLAGEELSNLLSSTDELTPVSPFGVFRVGQ